VPIDTPLTSARRRIVVRSSFISENGFGSRGRD
jgi:hypothetical protein